MKTLVIASQKGGSGKTTLAAHLSVAAELAGKGGAVLIDTDPQQTLDTWWHLRTAESPALGELSDIRKLPEKIEALAAAGFSYCLIDTPPALTKTNAQVLNLADLVLIPTRPSPADVWSLGATLDLVKESGAPPFVFVLTQAKGNARITVETLAALSEYGQVAPAVIHDRVDYASSMTDGRTALEINAGSPASIEITALWSFTRKRIGELAKSSESANKERRGKTHA